LRKDLSWLTARPIAHRGYHDATAGRPENTLAAFEAAAAAGYAIECDLQLSADDIPVVFHDDDLRRLTGATGATGALTADELGCLKVLGSKEKIPTLDEMLGRVAGRAPVVIELKSGPRHDPTLSRATIDVLRKYPGPVAVMSFDQKLLASARGCGTDVPLGLTAAGDWRSAARHCRALFALRLDFISYAIKDLPTPMPLAARALGKPLICWTVRTELERAKAKKWADQITFEGFAA